MYRESDELCDELDEAPEDLKKQKFREKWDCLSKQSTNMVSLIYIENVLIGIREGNFILLLTTKPIS